QIAIGKLLHYRFELLHRRSKVQSQEVTNHPGDQDAYGNSRRGEKGQRSARRSKAGDEDIAFTAGGNNGSAPGCPGGSGKQRKEARRLVLRVFLQLLDHGGNAVNIPRNQGRAIRLEEENLRS